jgi:hypothetical protein
MKAKVYSNISGSALVKLVPPPLRGQVELRGFEKEPGAFTLLVFPAQRQDIVLSGAVAHVLSRTAPDESLVALGGCFTVEALALLKARRAEVFTQSDFTWTDAGVQAIRVVIASPVKSPRGSA